MDEYGYLIRCAIDMLAFSYAPYSHFKVGAALLAKTNCAERTAFFRAIAEGVREFDAIAIVGGKDGVLTEYSPPCGVCRQVMQEFCNPSEFKIILAVSETNYKVYTLSELLPLGFDVEL